MIKKESKLHFWTYNIIKSLLLALLLAIIVALIIGDKFILVNGWSAEPTIPYHSLIITQKFDIADANIGDFITFDNNKSTAGYITHQLIGVKKDSTYFKSGDIITGVIDGIEYSYTITDEDLRDKGQINIILMQRQGQKFDITKDKNFINYDMAVGKLKYVFPVLGNTIFVLKENLYILIGLIACIVMAIIMKEQFSIEPKVE